MKRADNIHEQMGELEWKLIKSEIGSARQEKFYHKGCFEGLMSRLNKTEESVRELEYR